LTIVTDLPGWYDVGRAWTLFMLLVLATSLATQSLAWVARAASQPSDSESPAPARRDRESRNLATTKNGPRRPCSR
jgi:hypothetical protein